MDWDLYDRDLRHEKVKQQHLKAALENKYLKCIVNLVVNGNVRFAWVIDLNAV